MDCRHQQEIRSGDVVVIRNEGPKRRAGHARNAERDRCSRRRGIGILSCAIDRRAASAARTHGLMADTSRPEARAGRPHRRRARDGDMIRFDVSQRVLEVELSR